MQIALVIPSRTTQHLTYHKSPWYQFTIINILIMFFFSHLSRINVHCSQLNGFECVVFFYCLVPKACASNRMISRIINRTLYKNSLTNTVQEYCCICNKCNVWNDCTNCVAFVSLFFFFVAFRRMFPTVRVSFSGPFRYNQPSDRYAVLLDIVPLDNRRYRYAYHRSAWLVAGKADPPPPARRKSYYS